MASSTVPYPYAHRSDHVDDYHGERVPDPYRWLEEPDAPDTRAWIAAEVALCDAFLAQIPERDGIRRRLTEVWDYERYGLPTAIGGRYVYSKNTGLQNQSVIYIAETLDGPARVLLDPNTLSDDGTVALSGASFSEDGRRFAYATSASGSDWMTWRIREVETGSDGPDEVRWAKFSGASWRTDGSGFYYSRYAQPSAEAAYKDENYHHRVFFHRAGTDQADDVLVYARPDHPDWLLSARATEDGRWLVIVAERGSEPYNRVFIKDVHASSDDVIELLPDGDANYHYIGNDGETFYFQTTKDALRGRVIAVEMTDRAVTELVAETDDTLESASLLGDVLVLEYLRDARSVVVRRDLRGDMLGEVALPGLGTASGFGGKRNDRETFFSHTSYTMPSSIYRLDPATGATALVFRPQVSFDPDDFVSEQRFYTSADGTRIPIIITAKRGTPRNGDVPTILYGYGGFNISLTPAFSPATLVWLERGGAFAVANLRGGGEYGEAWHAAGTKERKQNVFDDFIAAAEFLIAERYTSTPKLAIFGGSNGGLLVAACLTQRPELFGAAIPAVGVLDMLRFQKFTIGWAWTSDYGTSDEPDQFAYLRAYSPLHNLERGRAYPPTLIVTADHDDRVFPAHSFKFAAALQDAQGGDAPVLIRIETKAGHGAGKPTSKVIDEAADRYAFLIHVLGMQSKESEK